MGEFIVLCPVDAYHGRDAFREMLSIWVEDGFCEVRESKTNYCWVNEEFDFLLYDWPRTDDRLVPPFKNALFCNTVPVHEKIRPWTFFPRHPRKLREKRKEGTRSYDDRNIHSLFLGKVENPIQQENRTTHDWSKSVEVFSMPITLGVVNKWPYTQEEYLEKVSSSRFGLCLQGYGPKCNREIEYMGLGTVPVVTPGVDITYHESWEEGKHYVRVNSPDDLHILESIDKNEWEYMSNECLGWYERNCTPKGSYDLTKNLYYETL